MIKDALEAAAGLVLFGFAVLIGGALIMAPTYLAIMLIRWLAN